MVEKRFSNARWEELLSETIAKVRGLATIKGGEYAGGDDRLENFRRNGAEQGLSMEQVWRVYAGKHWDSINTYIRDLAEGRTRPRSESMLGRADDLIVYSILLKAMILEREEEARVVVQLKPELYLDKSAPESLCDHRWMRASRWADVCVFCNSFRDHPARPR